MKLYQLLPILLFAQLLMGQSNAKPITELSQKELENIVLLDVRTPEEFANGHLIGALNVNWFDSRFEEQLQKIPKDQKIYVYCQSGGRSAKAQQKLIVLGYTEVVNLEGGYSAYSRTRR